MLALVIGKETPEPYRAIAWLLLAAMTFLLGWRRRLFDFRVHGYLVGVLGIGAALVQAHALPLACAAGMGYARWFVCCGPRRIASGPANAGSCAATAPWPPLSL